MDVSVIIPVYNRREMLGEALTSVIVQSRKAMEIIVIDDGSTDGTAELIRKDFPFVVLIVMTLNRGGAAARNAGISAARGELIAFLDSDDIWLPNYIFEQIKFMEEKKDIACSFCGHFNMDANEKIYPVEHDWPISHPQLQLVLHGNFVHTMSVFVVKKEVFLNTALLREDLLICHDRELYIRILDNYTISYNPRLLVKRRFSPDQLTHLMSVWYVEANELLKIFFRTLPTLATFP